jgi:K+-transporting ATPase A subunit
MTNISFHSKKNQKAGSRNLMNLVDILITRFTPLTYALALAGKLVRKITNASRRNTERVLF